MRKAMSLMRNGTFWMLWIAERQGSMELSIRLVSSETGTSGMRIRHGNHGRISNTQEKKSSNFIGITLTSPLHPSPSCEMMASATAQKLRLGDLDAVGEGGSVRVPTLPFLLTPFFCTVCTASRTLSFLFLFLFPFPFSLSSLCLDSSR